MIISLVSNNHGLTKINIVWAYPPSLIESNFIIILLINVLKFDWSPTVDGGHDNIHCKKGFAYFVNWIIHL